MEKGNYIIRYGLYMYAGIAGLFLFMKLVGLEEVTVLRFLNVFILAIFSIRIAQIITKEKGSLDYLRGLFTIFLTNIFALVLSLISLTVYLKYIDPKLLETLKDSIWFPGELTISKIIGAIFIEGAAMAVIISFAVMQYYKDNLPSSVKKSRSKA